MDYPLPFLQINQDILHSEYLFIKIWQVWHQRRKTMVLDLSITVCLASMEVLIQRSLKNWQSDWDPRCCKLLLSIVWRGEESGLQEKENHKRNIGCLEPFLEAAPQVRCTNLDSWIMFPLVWGWHFCHFLFRFWSRQQFWPKKGRSMTNPSCKFLGMKGNPLHFSSAMSSLSLAQVKSCLGIFWF